jgi:2-haloacid dehalogenase
MVILFDVYGTVVDWRSTVGREVAALGRRHGIDRDWEEFADRWRREGYLAPIAAMVSGAQPLQPIDAVLRTHLARLTAEYGFELPGADLEVLAGVWDRLDPWPDAVAGLTALRARATIAPLSNGTFAGMTRLARRAGLPWDCILSTELWGTFKPDPRTYRGACALLGVAPSEATLVAAHPTDLEAAAGCGLRTAYVPRPLEWGPFGPQPEPDDGRFDLVAADLLELAAAL